ncbi:DUF7305 domain-containing protein [Chroococcidiopsis sp.]|uniref:DUF7305 domain-containing protein n=1 Tax=Chroococcidiopsis sp. TaxID=3088168 RepID=UPI003F31869D
MSPKLKFALICRYSDRGFALPIAISLGFIILLVVATLLMRSQGDQMTALAQKSTSQGLSAAETGVTRYQALISNNPVIATYKDCEGTRNATTGACPDTGTTKSWANASKIPGISSCSGYGSGATTVVDKSSIAWTDVDTSNPNKGQYRLISYVYPVPGTTGTVGTTPGTGQLTVEGRVNQVGTGSTATQSAGTAITRLQVNIPVSQGNLSSTPVPGLWLTTGNMPGNQKTKGNILLNDCSLSPKPPLDSHQAIDTSVTPNRPYLDPNTNQPYQTKQFGFIFPDLPSPPNFTSIPSQVLGTMSSDTFPRNGDRSTTGAIYPATGGIFEYSVTSIGNVTINIRTNTKVRFYLEGSIAKQANIHHDCTGVTGCDPTDFQIFGYGDNTKSICLNGNGILDGFVFAPAYSGGVDGNGKFRGSLWVDNFNAPSCSSSSNHTVVEQLASWTSLGLSPKGLPPIIAPINTWQKQEIP